MRFAINVRKDILIVMSITDFREQYAHARAREV